MIIRAHKIGLMSAGALLVGTLTLLGGAAASASTAPSARAVARPSQALSAAGDPILVDGNYYGSASSNWSGYVVTTGPYETVTGEWTVPAVTAAHGPTTSSAWIGIGGNTTADLIQVGTSQQAFHHAATYSAWWSTNEENYFGQGQWTLSCASSPCTGTPTALTVHPGDVMVASIEKTGTTLWAVTLTDTTTGVEGTMATIEHTSSTGATGGNSAEWIVERTSLVAPSGRTHLAKLANFGTVTFDTVTANTGAPQLVASATTSDAILMVQSPGRVIAIPSVPDTDANGFSVAYGDSAPTPPTS